MRHNWDDDELGHRDTMLSGCTCLRAFEARVTARPTYPVSPPSPPAPSTAAHVIDMYMDASLKAEGAPGFPTFFIVASGMLSLSYVSRLSRNLVGSARSFLLASQ